MFSLISSLSLGYQSSNKTRLDIIDIYQKLFVMLIVLVTTQPMPQILWPPKILAVLHRYAWFWVLAICPVIENPQFWASKVAKVDVFKHSITNSLAEYTNLAKEKIIKMYFILLNKNNIFIFKRKTEKKPILIFFYIIEFLIFMIKANIIIYNIIKENVIDLKELFKN